MKECCVLLVPQEEIANIAQSECQKRGWPCKVIYCVNNSVAVELAKKYRESGVKVFISRGGMAKAVEKEAKATVIPIEIGFQDIAEAAVQAKDLGTKVGISINTAVEHDLNRIRSMFQMEIETIKTPPDGLLIDAIQSACENGFQVIIGGVAPVYFAQLAGMKTVSLRSGKKSVLTAIEKAMARAGEGYGLEIFQTLQEGIVVLDQDERVLYINDSASRMFTILESKVLNKTFQEALPMLSVSNHEKQRRWKEYEGFTYNKKQFIKIESDFLPGKSKIGKVVQIYDAQMAELLYNKIYAGRDGGHHTAKYTFSDIVARDLAMTKLIEKARLYAGAGTTILITGETGTGKELLAQSIHNASSRRNQPFIAVNCSAIPESILESELFGYEPGSFTGALRSGKKGIFEAAEGGTVFLDEIGELPPKVQAKLLRVLQEKEIMKVGGSQAIPFCGQVIAATLADLKEAIEKGSFRKDLYYRLNILNLHIPPLRERKEDIPLLVQGLSEKICSRLQVKLPSFHQKDIKLLQEYPWEGNVRELENILERIIILKGFQEENQKNQEDFSDVVREVLEENTRKGEGSKEDACKTLEEEERQIILKALKRNRGDREEACRELGISTTTLWRRLKEWGLQNEKF
ncbi:sigma 54-interacting transcriptional regulator [Lachnoclostridium edouardi]|uniref:sigma 54-interacting transcriptional regulator n=1 Tax=Lachnoclostridium edouardi TaxID=1926283 RepID=UPI000C7D974E|nr:sigma 54-interacting transcriptional regulator [Lachnoclostridium edouardi]